MEEEIDEDKIIKDFSIVIAKNIDFCEDYFSLFYPNEDGLNETLCVFEGTFEQLQELLLVDMKLFKDEFEIWGGNPVVD